MESYSLSQLSSWDLFFYYGQNDLDLEIESDLTMLVLQESRSLFYDNLESGGVGGYENRPSGFGMEINTRYDIAKGVSWKNSQISNGEDGYPDRRVAVSQNSIKFEANSSGEVNIDVLYIPYYNYNNFKSKVIPVPGVK